MGFHGSCILFKFSCRFLELIKHKNTTLGYKILGETDAQSPICMYIITQLKHLDLFTFCSDALFRWHHILRLEENKSVQIAQVISGLTSVSTYFVRQRG